jgi:hypothetical protein
VTTAFAALAIGVDVEQLTVPGGLLDQLADLITTPAAKVVDDAGPIAHAKIVGSPAPWHAAAGEAYMAIHAEAREIEQDARYRITGHTGALRGGSDENTRAALRAVEHLVHALDEDHAHKVGRDVARLVRLAREALGESERWAPLRRQPGQLPPVCPYCETYGLRILPSTGEVRCVNPECRDTRGKRPSGHAEHAHHTRQGHAAVVFADGAEAWWVDENAPDDLYDTDDQEQTA